MAASFKKQPLKIYTNSSETAEKLINYIMKNGKKNTARNIYKATLQEIKKQGHMNPQIVVDGAIQNAAPSVMVKSKRVGGAVYQVPLEVKATKKVFFACKWMLNAARTKKGTMAINLAEEIMAAYAEQGAAVKKKEEAHRMAEANKAYAYMAKYVK